MKNRSIDPFLTVPLEGQRSRLTVQHKLDGKNHADFHRLTTLSSRTPVFHEVDYAERFSITGWMYSFNDLRIDDLARLANDKTDIYGTLYLHPSGNGRVLDVFG